MRSIAESIRRTLPESEHDCEMFIRGAAYMFGLFVVSLIVCTILGLRAIGQLP